MVMLGIVGGISEEAVEAPMGGGLFQGGAQLRGVLGRSKAYVGARNEMALGFCHQAELREATAARALTLALNVIPADMACLESCGIGDGGRTLRCWHRPQEFTLQGANARATHQAVLGVAQGRVVGQAFQFERPAQLGEILEQGHQPSIVGAKELPQHQAGKQLGLREALRGVLRGIPRQRSLGYPPCRARNPQRGFTHWTGRLIVSHA